MNIEYNYTGLICNEVSTALIDACFTEEQKEILKYQQGQIEITAVDELEKHYGNKYLTFTLEITKKRMAMVVHDYAYLLDQIKMFNEKIIELTKPETHYKRRISDTLMDNTTITAHTNKSDSANTTTSKAITVDESLNETTNAGFRRAATAGTHVIHQGIENWDTQKEIEYRTNLKIEKKQVNIDFDNERVALLGDVEAKREALPEDTAANERIIPYNTFNYDFNKSGAMSTGYSSAESGATEKFKGVSTDNSSGGSVGHAVGNVDFKDFKRSDAIVRSFVVKVVNLRLEFFGRFSDLFRGYPPHQLRYVK